jgi:hypothetical protein
VGEVNLFLLLNGIQGVGVAMAAVWQARDRLHHDWVPNAEFPIIVDSKWRVLPASIGQQRFFRGVFLLY